MALVEYPESDSSDDAVDMSSKGSNVKPAFRKVVDRAHPNIIRIALAEDTNSTAPAEEAEPPKKRARLESSAIGGFNALLPAPKRPAVVGGHFTRNVGLGRGVGLKTGATPGFIREGSNAERGAGDGQLEEIEDIYNSKGIDEGSSDRQQTVEDKGQTAPPITKLKVEVPKQGNAMMFKPLSVARNKKKKKAPLPAERDNNGSPISNASQPQTAKPKISLFTTETTEISPDSNPLPTEIYQPMIYRPPNPEPDLPTPPPPNPPTKTPSAPPPSLTAIAQDLNLSASAKRQLLGRHPSKNSKTPQQPITIVNFNTDQEYAANELMRQAGEQQGQLNTVRAIAPGKHSLKQLVNAASSQKEAFEEQFATGRRNKKEAGGRYGW